MFTSEVSYLIGFFVVDDNKQSARIPAHVRDNNQKQVKNGSKYGVRWNNKINIFRFFDIQLPTKEYKSFVDISTVPSGNFDPLSKTHALDFDSFAISAENSAN